MKHLFLALLFIQTALAADYYRYEEATQVPEPMFYDLVRSLHSKKGELEINSLFYQAGDSRLRTLHLAPEIEFVPTDNWGIEIELPTADGQIQSYKFAIQHGLERQTKSLIQGWQIIVEKNHTDERIDSNITHLIGKRFKNKFSFFSIFGARHAGEDYKWREILNVSLFYDILERVDFGIETNLISQSLNSEFLQILPQIHLALDEQFKIQMGTGVQYLHNRWHSTAALRLIREWNL